jgi:lipid-A-disaccharide synthase
VVASGTATVEAALIGNPFVVVYRVSPLTYAIAKRVVKVPHVAMANLIAGKRVVPELIQHDFTAANIVQQIEPLLPDGPPRESMMKELKAIRDVLNARPEGNEQRPAPSNGWRRLPFPTWSRFPIAPPAVNHEIQ